MNRIEYQGKEMNESVPLMNTITEDSAIIVLVVRTHMITPSEGRTLHPAEERTIRSLHVEQPRTQQVPVLTLLAERSPAGVMNGESDDEVDELPQSTTNTLKILTAKKRRLSNRFSRCFSSAQPPEEFEKIPEENLETGEFDLSSDSEGSQRLHSDSDMKQLPNGNLSSHDETPSSLVPEGMELQPVTKENSVKGIHMRDTLKHIVKQYGTLRGETLHAECFRLVIRDTEKEKQWKPTASVMFLEEEEKKSKLKMKRMIKQLLDDPNNDERNVQKSE